MPPWRRSAIPCPSAHPRRRNCPGTYPIEASVPCAEPFDDRDWLFSVDWDGARALLFLDPGGAVRIQGELPGDLAHRFPDVVAAASVRGGRGAVLDGVIAVLDREGRPDLAGFGRRLAVGAAAAGGAPGRLISARTCSISTDARSRGGRWTAASMRSSELTGATDSLQAPDHVRGRGEALAAAASGASLPALARPAMRTLRTGPGVASPDRLRIALANQTTCVVAGVVSLRRGGTRLILAEHVAGRLTFAGPGGWTARSGRRRVARAARRRPLGEHHAARRRPAGERVMDPPDPHRDRPPPRPQRARRSRPPDAPGGSGRRRPPLVRATAGGGGPDRCSRRGRGSRRRS